MSISVIMTCHNEAKYIAQAIRSVTSQTAYDVIEEIIVVNDGSTDNSARVLADLELEIPKLRVIKKDGIGLPAARNCAIRESAGSLIALLDGDDYWVPEKTALQLPAFSSLSVGLVYSDYVDFSAPDAHDAQFISVRPYRADNARTLCEYFVHDAPIMPSTTIIRRAVFDDVGFFDDKLRIGEDTEMFLRIAERWRFQHVPGGLFYKRRHATNITRRLDVLLPIAVDITRKFVARDPELACVAGRRMSRRYARAGNDCAQHGDFRLAMKYLIRAVGCDPLFWRPYVYLLLALVPQGMSQTVRRSLRAVFHGLRAERASAGKS